MKYFILTFSLSLMLHFFSFAQPKSESMTNIYNYKKVVVLELIADGEAWDVEVLEVCQGVPTKSLVSDRSIKMDFIDKKNQVMYSVSVGDPKQMQIHTEANAISAQREEATSITVVVPYDRHCEKVICSQSESLKSKPSKTKTFDIKKDIAKANQSFMSKG